jgi:hypothetical protein
MLLRPLRALVEPAVVDVVGVEQHRDLLRAIERGARRMPSARCAST